MSVIDEIEYSRLMKNLTVLVKDIPDPVIRNPMLAMIAALDALNERIIELQIGDEDD